MAQSLQDRIDTQLDRLEDSTLSQQEIDKIWRTIELLKSMG